MSASSASARPTVVPALGETTTATPAIAIAAGITTYAARVKERTRRGIAFLPTMRRTPSVGRIRPASRKVVLLRTARRTNQWRPLRPMAAATTTTTDRAPAINRPAAAHPPTATAATAYTPNPATPWGYLLQMPTPTTTPATAHCPESNAAADAMSATKGECAVVVVDLSMPA